MMAVAMLPGFGMVSTVRASPGQGDEPVQAEAAGLEVKAAYLYKFANYIEWPDGAFRNPTQPIAIGVLGADELAGELQRLVQDKSIKGRGFVVRRLQPGDDLGDLHILFIGNVDRPAIASALAAADVHHFLTVSESRRVFASGGMVNLVVVNQRIRFEVALPPVQRSRLRLSALMLTAAYRVVKDRP
jgi:hypothetical protein